MSDGVPEWAQKEYREQSRRKLIASMTLDGEIGSLYFGEDVEGAEDLEGGRIRLTHNSGPEEAVHPHLQRVQFNVDMKRAKEVYDEEGDGKFSVWLANYLNKNHTNPPDWAGAEILEPEDAPTDVSGNLKLFEIFVDSSNNVKVRHESRGEAVQYDTDKQTVAILRAAIKQVHGMSPDDANEAFYEFVKKLLPSSDIVEKMREP